LFDPGLRDPERFADTLARLAALVGPDRVGTPVLDDAHGDESFQLTSAAAEPLVLRETPARFGEAQPRERPVSALRRVRPPWEARVTLRDGRPEQVTAGGVTARVTDCAGPWRSSGRWWESPPWWREEWDILWNGAAHRLVRTPAGWRVEGVYD
jgi:protein ImuB